MPVILDQNGPPAPAPAAEDLLDGGGVVLGQGLSVHVVGAAPPFGLEGLARQAVLDGHHRPLGDGVLMAEPLQLLGGGGEIILAGRSQGRQGLAARHAVLDQTLLLLQQLHRTGGAAAVDPVHTAGVQAQLLQGLLEALYRTALVAGAQGLAGFLLGSLFQRGQGLAARHAVLGQALLLLEGLHRLDRTAAVVSVHAAGIQAQILQGLLQALHPAAAVTGAQRIGGCGLLRALHLAGDLQVLLHHIAGVAAVAHLVPVA